MRQTQRVDQQQKNGITKKPFRTRKKAQHFSQNENNNIQQPQKLFETNKQQ